MKAYHNARMVKTCVQAGATDFLIDNGNYGPIVQRLRAIVADHNTLAERLVSASGNYLGPAARIFLDRGARAIGFNALTDVRQQDLPALLQWVRVNVAPCFITKQ